MFGEENRATQRATTHRYYFGAFAPNNGKTEKVTSQPLVSVTASWSVAMVTRKTFSDGHR